jgi:sucrose-6-phosphate hydrolase SacC (GH32 family)
LKPNNGIISLRIYLDRASVEVFASEGRVYMPLSIIPADGNRSLSVSCANGEVKANYLRVHELKSAWK